MQELDTPQDTRWFASVTLINESPSTDLRSVGRRRDDTRAEVLAYEIARYMPDLARDLVNAGRRKMLAA